MSLEDIAAQTRIPAAPPREPRSRQLGRPSGADLYHRLREQLCDRGRARPDRDRRPVADGNGRQRFIDRDSPKCSSPPTRRGPCPNGWCSARSSPSSCWSLVMTCLNKRSLEPPADVNAAATQLARRGTGSAASHAAAAPAQPVVLTASAPVWLQISEKGGATLFGGDAAAGPDLYRPADRDRAGAQDRQARALRIKVGNRSRPAGRAAGNEGQECQPAAGRPDAGPAASAAAAAPPPSRGPTPAARSSARRRSPSAVAAGRAADQHRRCRDLCQRKPRRGTIATSAKRGEIQ